MMLISSQYSYVSDFKSKLEILEILMRNLETICISSFKSRNKRLMIT